MSTSTSGVLAVLTLTLLAGCDCGYAGHSRDAGADTSADAPTDAAEEGDANSRPDAGISRCPDPSTPDQMPRCVDDDERRIACPPDLPWCCMNCEGGGCDPGSCSSEDESNDSRWCWVAQEHCEERPREPHCTRRDRDGDGFDWAGCGGVDCDDDDAAVHPGAIDLVEPEGSVDEATPEPRQVSPESLAIAPDGEPSIAVGAIYSRSEAFWAIGGTFELGGAVALAFDSSGAAHVALDSYPDASVAYAERIRGDWLETVLLTYDDAPCRFCARPSLAVDHEDRPSVAIVREDGLHVIRRDGERWTDERVDSWRSEPGKYFDCVSLAVGPADERHVAYTLDGDLHHAFEAAGGWQIELVDRELRIGACAMAVDSAGDSHIVYSSYTLGDLYYATEGEENGYRIELLARHAPYLASTYDQGGWLGAYPSVSVAPDDSVHVLYDGGRAGGLRYARRVGDSWDQRSLRHAGWRGSIAASGRGSVRLAYEYWPSGPWYGAWFSYHSAARPLQYLEIDDLRRADQNCDGSDGMDADADTHASLVTGGDDCDDEDPWVYGGARDMLDGTDQNCTGVDGDDQDGDRFLSDQLGGDDCDDRRDDVFPGVRDNPNTEVDESCGR